ncbi:PAAR domain-containing protein [Pseudomonas aeruginosa]
MAFVIREGDPTTTGGIVVTGSSTHTVEFRKAARISDPVWCPACKSMGFIAEGNPTVIDEYFGCPQNSEKIVR